MLAGAAVTGTIAAALWLPQRTVLTGLAIASVAAGYLAAFPGRALVAGAKHFIAAPIFALGVFAVHPARNLLLPGATFAALCLGNMLLVESWEQGPPVAPVTLSLARIALIGAAVGSLSLNVPIAVAAILLLGLDLFGGTLPAELRSVLADVSLLTPVVF